MNDLIERIVTAARRPRSAIIPTTQLKFDDGNWYGIGGPPNPQTRLVNPPERRICGYVFRANNGTTFGRRFATAEEAHNWQDTARARTDEEFRDALLRMTPERLKAQATFWLAPERMTP